MSTGSFKLEAVELSVASHARTAGDRKIANGTFGNCSAQHSVGASWEKRIHPDSSTWNSEKSEFAN
jgi:hypothetical protein